MLAAHWRLLAKGGRRFFRHGRYCHCANGFSGFLKTAPPDQHASDLARASPNLTSAGAARAANFREAEVSLRRIGAQLRHQHRFCEEFSADQHPANFTGCPPISYSFASRHSRPSG